MRIEAADVVVVGGGAAGLSAALAALETFATDGRNAARVALVSKVYPMRSHTVAAEGGAAGVVPWGDDSLDAHLADTLASGSGLGDQAAAQWILERAPRELARLDRLGMPWSRDDSGRPAVRRFGGMSNPRTWFAADKTGFHMLHTLFQESLRHTLTTADSRDSAAPSIIRYDEHIALDLLMSDGGGARGIVAYDQQQGHVVAFVAPAVILATGGAARAWGTSTNAGIVTGDGLSMALRAGLALRDIEFVQVHPTCLPATGILITEAARGEGGVLLDRNGDRYLADYGLGPVTPVGQPVPRTMELGPRDRLSQAFWKADRDGRTIPWHDGADGAAGSVGAAGGGETDAASGTSAGARRNVVHLDLRHVGDFLLKTRLPLVTGLARRYVGVDPRFGLIPVCPAAHYTMGGIPTTPQGQVLDGAGQAVPGLYAAGECASTGLHGANRLGSNSLVETLVVGRAAGALAAGDTGSFDGLSASPRYSTTDKALTDQAEALAQPWLAMRGQGSESPAHIRRDLGALLDADVGIYCDADGLARARASIDSLRQRFADVRVADTSSVFNTDWAQALQVGAMLDVAAAVVAAAEGRHESRGAHQRIDHPDADAAPKHSIVVTGQTGVPEVSYV